MNKRERELRKLAASFGREVKFLRGGHIALVAFGKPVVITSTSPSDHRTGKNLRAQLRKADVWLEELTTKKKGEGQ